MKKAYYYIVPKFCRITRMVLAIVIFLVPLVVFTQDSTDKGSNNVAPRTDQTITTNDDTGLASWYTQPWAWVVASIIVLFLLVVIFRRGGGKTITRTTVTKKNEY